MKARQPKQVTNTSVPSWQIEFGQVDEMNIAKFRKISKGGRTAESLTNGPMTIQQMGQCKSAKWPNRNPQNGPIKIRHVDSLNITQTQDIKQKGMYDFLYKYKSGPSSLPFGKTLPGSHTPHPS